MEWLLKNLPLSMVLPIVSVMLIRIGNSLKNSDDNETGNDDAAGNVLFALAPAIIAFESKNDSVVRKTLTTVRNTINNYLDSSADAPEPQK